MIWPLWILWLGGCVWLLLLPCVRRMPFLVAYVAFGALRTLWLMSTSLLCAPTRYWACYWPLQGVGFVLASLLALSLLHSVQPRLRRWWYALGALVVLLPFVLSLGAGTWAPWLMAAKWCDLAIMALLTLALMWYDQRWKQPQEGLTWGLVVGVAGHVLCALVQGEHDPAEWLRVCYQLAGVGQLGVWVWALRG